MSKNERLSSIIIKVIVTVSAGLGTFLSWYAGRDSFMGGNVVYKYFTIQSNILLAIICAVGLVFVIKNKIPGRICQIIKFVGTVSITLTGVVFCFVLAPTIGAEAWNIQNILTHVIVPVASIVDFLISGKHYTYKLADDIWVIVPPICYVIYAAIGYVNNWEFGHGLNYPYFFLNWGSEAGVFGFTNELPFMGCGWWILALMVFLLILGFVYLKIVGHKKSKD